MLPRTHMVLTLELEGREWLADVGFGGDGLIEPIPTDGAAVEQDDRFCRVTAEERLRVLQSRRSDAWEDLYAVLPDPAHAVDFEMANWFTSTWPQSRFVLTLTAQRITGGARHVLRNLTYTVARGSTSETREISRPDLVPLLRSVFDLDVPLHARFKAIDG